MLANSTKPTLLLIDSTQSMNIYRNIVIIHPCVTNGAQCGALSNWWLCCEDLEDTRLFEVPDQFTADPTRVRGFLHSTVECLTSDYVWETSQVSDFSANLAMLTHVDYPWLDWQFRCDKQHLWRCAGCTLKSYWTVLRVKSRIIKKFAIV